MPRLLVFSTQLLHTGGIESHILQFCKEVSGLGYELDLLVLHSEMDQSQRNVLESFCKNIYFINDYFKIRKAFQLPALFIKILSCHYDVFYTNGQGRSIFYLAKIFRYKKHIHHHHTAGDEIDRRTWPKKYINVMQKANLVIACSATNSNSIASILNRQIGRAHV